MHLLDVKDLAVQFSTQDGPVMPSTASVLRWTVGQTLGIVGESGSGKSQTVLAMMGLLARNGRPPVRPCTTGRTADSCPADLNRIRGNRMAMIFQDPMTSLNPYLTVERQMTEVLQLHKGMTASDARASCHRACSTR
jgi:oligopeptide transport system ATP-binding protein